MLVKEFICNKLLLGVNSILILVQITQEDVVGEKGEIFHVRLMFCFCVVVVATADELVCPSLMMNIAQYCSIFMSWYSCLPRIPKSEMTPKLPKQAQGIQYDGRDAVLCLPAQHTVRKVFAITVHPLFRRLFVFEFFDNSINVSTCTAAISDKSRVPFFEYLSLDR